MRKGVSRYKYYLERCEIIKEGNKMINIFDEFNSSMQGVWAQARQERVKDLLREGTMPTNETFPSYILGLDVEYSEHESCHKWSKEFWDWQGRCLV
jgi:hypothetical protein